MSSDKIVHVTDASFDQEVLKSDTPVLVDFWAPWCGPCRAIAPILDDLAGEYSGRLKIAKINVDDNPQTPGRYGVRGIPNLLIIKGGQVKEQIIGAVPKVTARAGSRQRYRVERRTKQIQRSLLVEGEGNAAGDGAGFASFIAFCTQNLIRSSRLRS